MKKISKDMILTIIEIAASIPIMYIMIYAANAAGLWHCPL